MVFYLPLLLLIIFAIIEVNYFKIMLKKYKRVIIKISGEALQKQGEAGDFDFLEIKKLALAVKQLVKKGYQVGLVFGAGNIWRGRMVKEVQIDKVAADHMGMLATEINALAVAGVLEAVGQPAKIFSALSIPQVVEDFYHQKAIEAFKHKQVVLFAGGTGNPFFTTDTAFVLRAIEVNADYIFKATNVKGVYSADPKKDSKAKFYKTLNYQAALDQNLKVMDATAFALAQEKKLLLTVFQYSPANIISAVTKNNIGTKVS